LDLLPARGEESGTPARRYFFGESADMIDRKSSRVKELIFRVRPSMRRRYELLCGCLSAVTARPGAIASIR
jgi:hypothetical protein